MPLEPAPNASSRGTVVEAQVRLAKSQIEPVILAPSSFPLHFGGGGRAVRGQSVARRTKATATESSKQS